VVRKSSSHVTRMHFFPFYHQNKRNKAVRYGSIFIFCLHYYRSKAISRARQGGAMASARAVDLPARSFDLIGAPWYSAASHFNRSLKAVKQTTCTGDNGTEKDRQGSNVKYRTLKLLNSVFLVRAFASQISVIQPL